MKEATIAWKPVARGATLIVLGSFLLLTAQGALPWSFWLEALSYWPVILLAHGLRLILDRRAPWAALIPPVLLLGTLTYVATRQPEAGPQEFTPLLAERPEDLERWELSARMVLADLELTARPMPERILAEGRAAVRGSHEFDVSRTGNAARLKVASPAGGWPFPHAHGGRERWEIGLSHDLPLALDLDLAFTGGVAELTTLRLSRLSLEGAFNDLTLRLGEPTTNVRIDIEGVSNQVKLIVPSSTPVRVSTDGILNRVRGRPKAEGLEGPSYRLDVDGVLNRVTVESP